MRLLVTGGAGFIGSNFIRYWLSQHPADHITNLDALTYAGQRSNLDDLSPLNHTLIQGNICDADVVHRAMEGVEVVVHFAAESHVDRSIENSRVFLMTNVIGTHTLLEEVRRRGDQIKRFHHISTDEVFGSLTLDEEKKFNENTPYNPHSPYSASKAGADHLCRAYIDTHHLPITISNCSNNYGPYHFPEKFIPLMIVNAMRDIPLPIYGDGKNIRDWIHVEDHCAAVVAALFEGKPGAVYNFGGGNEMANLDLVKMILKQLGKPESLISFVKDRPGHDRRYAIDSSFAQKELKWKPRKDFEEGLESTVKWYIDNQAWWQPLLERAGRY